jgi:hypothetical protein
MFLIFWGEVSEDSDVPVEFCRPVPADEAEALAAHFPGVRLTYLAEPPRTPDSRPDIDVAIPPGAGSQAK